MKKFQFTNRINSNSILNFAEKAILNQLLSYQENNQIFHGTNKYLSETWGTTESTIKRTIANLKLHNLLIIDLQKKPHSNGESGEVWYNKRYISINIDELTKFLNNETIIEETIEELPIEKNEVINELPTLTIEDESYLDDNFNPVDVPSEYDKLIEEALLKKESPKIISEPKHSTIEVKEEEQKIYEVNFICESIGLQEYANRYKMKLNKIKVTKKEMEYYLAEWQRESKHFGKVSEITDEALNKLKELV